MHPIIINSSIYLDLIKTSEAQRLSDIANDLEISKNMGDTFPYPYTIKDAERWVNHCITSRDSGIEKHYGIYIDKQYAGNIGREQKSPNGRHKHNFFVGYWIGRDYWGKGYMTEIFQIFSDHIFATIPLCHRQYSGVYSRNHASRRVMEKCGFHLEAEYKKAIIRDGKFYDEWILARIRPTQ